MRAENDVCLCRNNRSNNYKPIPFSVILIFDTIKDVYFQRCCNELQLFGQTIFI